VSLLLEVHSHWLLCVGILDGTLVLSPPLPDFPLRLTHVLTFVLPGCFPMCPLVPSTGLSRGFARAEVQTVLGVTIEVFFDGDHLAAVLDLDLGDQAIAISCFWCVWTHPTGLGDTSFEARLRFPCHDGFPDFGELRAAQDFPEVLGPGVGDPWAVGKDFLHPGVPLDHDIVVSAHDMGEIGAPGVIPDDTVDCLVLSPLPENFFKSLLPVKLLSPFDGGFDEAGRIATFLESGGNFIQSFLPLLLDRAVPHDAMADVAWDVLGAVCGVTALVPQQPIP